MAAAHRTGLAALLLTILALAVHVSHASTSEGHRNYDAHAAGSPVDCSLITAYPHLSGWDDTAKTPDNQTIYLLNLYYSTVPNTDGVVEALLVGLRAAMEAHAYTTDTGRAIELVDTVRPSHEADAPEQYIAEALCRFGSHFYGVLGPFDDNRLRQLLDTGILQNNELVAFGPYTGSALVRFFSPHTYFMRADPLAELAAILNNVINHDLHRRVGYAYITNNNFGDVELEHARQYVERVGSSVVGVYEGDNASNDVDEASFRALVASHPQSIIVFSAPGVQTGALLQRILASEELKACIIYVPSFLNYELEAAVDALEQERDSSGAARHTVGRDRLVSTSTNYPAYDTSLDHIVAFREDATAYIDNHRGQPYDSPAVIDTAPSLSEMMINGWIVGRVVLQIFSFESWVRNRATLMTGIFRQNRYIIDGDFVLGDYGGECRSPQAALQGAMCECNQGGSTVFVLRHYENASQIADMNAVFKYSNTICRAENVRLPTPLNIIIINYEDDELFKRIDSQLREPGTIAINSLNAPEYSTGGTSFNVRAIHTTVDAAQKDLDAYTESHRVDVLMGPVLLTLGTADTLILSPIYRRPTPIFADPNKVVLRATLEQQYYVACDFLTRSASDHVFVKGTQVHVVLRNIAPAERDSIKSVVTKTAVNFRLKNPKFTVLEASDTLEQSLEKNAVMFLMGLRAGDAQSLRHYLESNGKSFILVLFQDIMMYYDEFIEAFSAATEAVQGRLVFATSYPMWNDNSTAAYEQYPILKSFHAVMGDTQLYTPRAFETYITSRLIDILSSSLQTISAEELKAQLYHTSNFLIDDLRLGPFRLCDASDEDCELRNYGANDIAIVSLRSVLSASQTKVFGPVTPAMTYSKPLLSKGNIVAIAVCGGLALIAAVVLPIVIYMCCCANSRDNKNAPKAFEHPVTIIFTDIESSTALWGTVPQLMPDAVATHHKIIREIIALHKGYEVKTVGDSFMIACKKPFAAVQIAHDIQKRFLAHSWDEDIDACYRQFEKRKADDPDNETYKPHSANLVRSVYDALWCGLRVRIGVHTGLSDIRHDEITGGFDYYGETSNMAARTEAIGNGGQVLLTEATWWALSQDERDALDVTSLGRQGLRGVSWPVEMFQLNAVPTRSFPPLRLEISAYLPNDDETQGTMSTDGMASSAATLTGPAAAIATVLTNCFSPYPPARRIKELLPLLQKWGIPVPPRHRRIAEEDYCQGLLNRLAVKMSSVVQIRNKLYEVTGELCRDSTSLDRASLPSRGFARATSRHTNPLGTASGLTTQSVSRLYERRGSTRHRCHSGRSGTGSSFAQPDERSASPSGQDGNSVQLLELYEAAPAVDDVDDNATSHIDLSPRGRSRSPRPHRNRLSLAALSTTSDGNSLIHVFMPDYLR